MENKNIDKLFKSKLQSSEIPYDASNWDKMSEYLDNNPIVRSRPYSDYLIAGTVLLFVLFIGVSFYLRYQSSHNHKPDLNPDTNRSITQNSHNPSATSSIRQNRPSESSDSNNSRSPLVNRLFNLSPSEKIAGEDSASAIFQLDGSVLSTTSRNKGDGSDIENENLIHQEGNKTINKFVDKGTKAKVKKNITLDDDNLLESELSKDGLEYSKSSVEVVEPLNIFFPEEISSEYNEKILNTTRNSKLLQKSKKLKPFLDAYLGAGFMARPDHMLIKGGVSIGIEINPNIFLRTGVAFSNQNTPRHAGYSFEKTVYGFGSDLDIYELQVDKTNSLSIPIELGFRKNRHAIFAGVELEKILASKGQFHLYPSGDSKIVKESGWFGNKAFLPEPTWNFLLGYEYYIGSKTIIGVRLESAMSNYINSNEEESFRAPGASNWGRAILQIRQKF